MHDGLVPVSEVDLERYPPRPKARVIHATLTYQDERNAAKTVHGIGFRAVCSCGESSRVFASYRMASAWNREHASTLHRTDRVSMSGPIGPRPPMLEPGA